MELFTRMLNDNSLNVEFPRIIVSRNITIVHLQYSWSEAVLESGNWLRNER